MLLVSGRGPFSGYARCWRCGRPHSRSPFPPAILVGDEFAFRNIRATLTDARVAFDGYVTRSLGERVLLPCGCTEQGHANAVYGWLRELGCRRFMPGTHGAVVPRVAELELGDRDREERPAYVHRQLWYSGLGHVREQAPAEAAACVAELDQRQRQTGPRSGDSLRTGGEHTGPSIVAGTDTRLNADASSLAVFARAGTASQRRTATADRRRALHRLAYRRKKRDRPRSCEVVVAADMRDGLPGSLADDASPTYLTEFIGAGLDVGRATGTRLVARMSRSATQQAGTRCSPGKAKTRPFSHWLNHVQRHSESRREEDSLKEAV